MSGRRPALLATGFAVAFILMFVVPPLAPYQFQPYRQIAWADVFDMFTPVVLMPLYWLLLRDAGPLSTRDTLLFVVLAAVWVEGQGIHLAANSIGHKVHAGSTAYRVTEFYDENLGHYLWHAGIVGLSAFVIARQWRAPAPVPAGGGVLSVVAGLVYGLAWFLVVVEAGTAPLGVTFAVLVAVFAAGWGRRRGLRQPVLALFLYGYTFSVVLFAVWAAIWHGHLPQFSQLGLIK
jgi:hypothetical protein